MRYELETPGGRHVPYVADSVTFEGGGVQLWRLHEEVQTAPRRELVAAWAPQAWVQLWPATVEDPAPRGVSPHAPAPVGLDVTTAGEMKHRTDLDHWEWLGASGLWRNDWPPESRWVDDYPVRVRHLVGTTVDADLVADRREDAEEERP